MVVCEICGEPIQTAKYICIGNDREGVHSECLDRYLCRGLKIPESTKYDLPELLFQLLEDAYMEDTPDDL